MTYTELTYSYLVDFYDFFVFKAMPTTDTDYNYNI